MGHSYLLGVTLADAASVFHAIPHLSNGWQATKARRALRFCKAKPQHQEVGCVNVRSGGACLEGLGERQLWARAGLGRESPKVVSVRERYPLLPRTIPARSNSRPCCSTSPFWGVAAGSCNDFFHLVCVRMVHLSWRLTISTQANSKQMP